MYPYVAPLTEIYKTNTGLVKMALADITANDAVKSPTDTTNSMQFIIGHLTNSRFKIGNMAGLADQCPWGDMFARGAKLKDISDYPSIQEILDTWDAISLKMIERFSEITEQELKVKAPYDFPVDDKTILGGIAFMALHDSYHVGQLAYIRKLLGYSSLVG
jgi:hypothetical protein